MRMVNQLWRDFRPGARGVSAVGVFIIVLSVVGLVVGWVLVGSLTRNFGASIDVSRSAIGSVGDTLDLVEELTAGTASSIDAASRSAASASETTRAAVAGLDGLAEFLDAELPTDIEAIRLALPGAIDAADAVDSTLGALSLFGVDYSPDEPFGESLRRVEQALDELPDEIRAQSGAIRDLVPSTEALANDSRDLAEALRDLNERLVGVDDVTAAYTATVVEAEAAIEQADDSLDRTILLFRLMLVLIAIAGVAVGFALISVDRAVAGAVRQPDVDETQVVESSRR